MTLSFKSPILLMILLSILCSCDQLKDKRIQINETDRLILDSIATGAFESYPMPGLAIGLVCNGEVYSKSFGYADKNSNQPFTNSTVFCSGVISEAFTAFLAQMLIQNFNNINHDSKVASYLPHFSLNSDNYTDITLKHILTQTAGIPFHNVFWDLPNFSDSALSMTTWSIRLQEPEFPMPGTRIVRSPYNFDIAADFIANASKLPFENFAQTYLFDPIGMKQSTYRYYKIQKADHAIPYEVDNWLTYSFKPCSNYPFSREHLGSIGWHTSINDASIWIKMVLNRGKINGKQVISSELIEEYLNPQYKTDQEGSYIGLGWEIKTVDKLKVFIKSGEVGGFNNALVLIPGINAGAIIVSNGTSDFQPAFLAQDLIFYLKDKVIPSYKKSIHIDMGKVLDSTYSVQEAIEFYERKKIEEPQKYDFSVLSISQLGANLFFRMGKESEALEIYKFCKKEYPDAAYTYLNFAEYGLYKKDTNRVEYELSKIAETGDTTSRDITERLAIIRNALDILKESNEDSSDTTSQEHSKDEICIPCEDDLSL